MVSGLFDVPFRRFALLSRGLADLVEPLADQGDEVTPSVVSVVERLVLAGVSEDLQANLRISALRPLNPSASWMIRRRHVDRTALWGIARRIKDERVTQRCLASGVRSCAAQLEAMGPQAALAVAAERG